MFITVDTLIKHAAFAGDVEEFIGIYPDGADALTVINDKKINLDFLHWIFEYLELNETEEKAYWKKIKVTDSIGVYQSYHVENSSMVSKSRVVWGSNIVYDSKEVRASAIILNSQFIEESLSVANSSFVERGTYILNSTNITDSKEVA